MLKVNCQVNGVTVQSEILAAKEVFCSAYISSISNILQGPAEKPDDF